MSKEPKLRVLGVLGVLGGKDYFEAIALPFTLHIDDTPENIARIMMSAPAKKADEWRYLKGQD